jgi:hypothetical protein
MSTSDSNWSGSANQKREPDPPSVLPNQEADVVGQLRYGSFFRQPVRGHFRVGNRVARPRGSGRHNPREALL